MVTDILTQLPHHKKASYGPKIASLFKLISIGMFQKEAIICYF